MDGGHSVRVRSLSREDAAPADLLTTGTDAQEGDAGTALAAGLDRPELQARLVSTSGGAQPAPDSVAESTSARTCTDRHRRLQ